MNDLLGDIVWEAGQSRNSGGGKGFVLAVIIFLAAIVALWQKNFFFFIFLLIAGVLVAIYKKRDNATVFRVSNDGVAIGGDAFYSYNQIESFCLRNHPRKGNELILKRRTSIDPYLKISVNGDAALALKARLQTKLPHFEYEDSLIDVATDFFGV